MKKLVLFFVALPVCVFGITFEKWYGGDSLDEGYAVCQTPDAGYIAVGYTMSFGQGQEDVYIIRTDSLGDTLWTKTYGSPDRDVGFDIFPVSDGYVVVGLSGDMSTYCDVYLLRINSSGDTLWTKTYDNAGNFDIGYKGAITPDNGYIIIGYTAMYNVRMYAIKTDSVGNVLWTKQYGAGDEGGLSVDLTPDGGYIFAGATGGMTPPGDVYLVKTDSVGDTLWTRKYGGTGDDYAFDVDLTSDNGFLITGSTTSFTPDTYDVYVIKTNLQGDTLWTRHYGGNYDDEPGRAFETSDGGYVISGYTNSFGSGTPDSSNAYIIKIDNTGNLLWERVYGGPTEDWVFSGYECLDKGFIFAGMSKRNFYLLKTDSTGLIGVEENAKRKTQNAKLEVYPNPSYGWADIKYETPYCHSERSEESIQLTVYDVAGKVVDKVFHKRSSPGPYTIRYKTTNLCAGIYFISINERVPKKKLIILK